MVRRYKVTLGIESLCYRRRILFRCQPLSCSLCLIMADCCACQRGNIFPVKPAASDSRIYRLSSLWNLCGSYQSSYRSQSLQSISSHLQLTASAICQPYPRWSPTLISFCFRRLRCLGFCANSPLPKKRATNLLRAIPTKDDELSYGPASSHWLTSGSVS